MDDSIRQALENDKLVDITTTGRKSGRQHTIEVGLRQIGGQVYLSNNPGTTFLLSPASGNSRAKLKVVTLSPPR